MAGMQRIRPSVVITTLLGLVTLTIPPAEADPIEVGPSPTISGPEIEQLLRANLQAAPGATTDASQIRCPVSRVYFDGDLARCSVPVGNGGVEVLLVTLFREGDGWRFAIDVQ